MPNLYKCGERESYSSVYVQGYASRGSVDINSKVMCVCAAENSGDAQSSFITNYGKVELDDGTQITLSADNGTIFSAMTYIHPGIWINNKQLKDKVFKKITTTSYDWPHSLLVIKK